MGGLPPSSKGIKVFNFHEVIKSYLDQFIHPVREGLYNLKGTLAPLVLASIKESFLLITESEDISLNFQTNYKFYSSLIKKPAGLIFFPDAIDPKGIGRQIEILIEADRYASITCSAKSLNSLFKPPEDLCSQTLTLRKNKEIQRQTVIDWLIESGYKQVSLVVSKGEFSSRNYIIDLFPANTEDPLRLEFFDDEIVEMRVFSVDSQMTIKLLEDTVLFPLNGSQIPLKEGTNSGGKYLYEIFDFDYIFTLDDCLDNPDSAGAGLIPQPLCNHKGYINGLENNIKKLSTYPIAFDGAKDAGSIPMDGLGILYTERASIYELPKKVREVSGVSDPFKKDNLVLIVCPGTAQAERIKAVFLEQDIDISIILPEDISNTTTEFSRIFITIGELTEGIYIPGLIILTDREIFGETHRYRSIERSRAANVLKSMDELNHGDYVVHDIHGIGIFEGLKKETTEGKQVDMLVIRYALDALLYVPVYGISAIKKYRSGTQEEGMSPIIDKLGGSSWLKVKKKVTSKIKDIAYRLIKLYAEREIKEGFAFSQDTEIHREFDNFFPYEPTPDQLKSIAEIKHDMESIRPMDRLLCGDVGYGKTEVAMRAVFKAIFDGKQAIILTPTTLLCEQHYLTFKERFSAFPVKIDFISRFRTRRDINNILKRLTEGEIDIVIGTHGLLRKDLNIKNLGLLIVDEEHRFGVAQKTRIKEIKKGVDCLSLSATPIPRTLQMALSGIWNMSSIETPPEDRLSIRTFISVFNEELIIEAIRRERHRSGQVFFIHNRIKDIDRIASLVKKLVPEVSIAVAHGQMDTHQLEDIMLNFMRGNTDVLVSTSIISSGLDIPRSNTIIINRADTIGLADLYQLRGRVGRSNLRAYAYFLVPSEDLMTDKAKKRLAAIEALSYLGAGLRLAMKDMEIRGAGNLIGAEQSGHIDAVGFDTYMEMLEEEIAIQKGQPQKNKMDAVIDLKVEAVLPDDYINDVSLRLSFYRRIASAGALEELYNLKDELRDRFGGLPISADNLLGIMRLKILANGLKITKIEQFNGRLKKVSVKTQAETILDLPLSLKDKVKYNIRNMPDGFDVLTDSIKEEDILPVMIELIGQLNASQLPS